MTQEKINIAELLKDCPRGMELDCTIYNGKVCFEGIDARNPACPIIKISVNLVHIERLDTWGQYSTRDYAKCAIFPKGKTTWEGFVPPCKFNDGDIITDSLGTCIFKGESEFEGCVNYYCGISNGCFSIKDDKRNPSGHYGFIVNYRLSTEEEKQQLFDAIKENGYKWNAETKTLEKLPKFKVGDKVRYKNNHNDIFTITSLEEDYYGCGIANAFCFEDQDDYELVQNKFDITTLKPFESRVLVRDTNGEKWKSNFWGFYDSDHAINHPHECCGNTYRQCIPYEGNEHLLGTTNNCDEYYKTWK